MTASSGYTVASGTLTGSAAGSTITGNLTNSGGTIDPGGTTGILSISGKYTQNSGTLSVGVDFTKKTNSSLAVGGMVTLADTLNVNFTGNPGRGTTWKIITYGATAGTDFATLTSNTGLKYVHVKPDVNNTYFIQIPNLQGQGVNFNILEGNSVGPIVADFTDPALADPSTGNYSAVIDWGDGTPTTTASTADNTIYPDGNGGWNILAVHPYADEGTYTITDVLTPDGDPAGVLTMSSTATVADQVTRASAVNGSATVGVPFSGVVATLTDANPLATADDFNVIIHWPDDGSASPGTVTGPTGGPFNVNGNHTFQSPGRWTLGVSIQDASAMLATANPTITVMPGGPGGMGGAAATSAARTTTAPPATGGTSVVFAIPMPDTALPMTEPPAAPSPGVASAPNPLPLSAPPATPDAAPALSPDAFDPRASYLAALAASDAAAGPLAGPDAYFASLS